MLIGLLGALQVHHDDGRAVPVTGARLRALLAMLALAVDRPVPADTLVTGLWGDQAPAGATNALQSLVSRLRRTLTTGDTATAPIRSEPAGYRLRIDRDATDTVRFATLTADGRRRLAAGDPHGAAEALHAALRLWRGPALADITAPFAASTADRLEHQRLDALADLAEAHLCAGEPDHAAAAVTGPAAEHPLSERLCGLAVRALHATGRQADALACYERTRHALADQLGIDPSGQLAAVHLAVLRGELPDTPAEPAPTRRTNLRTALSSFIGRDREITELRTLLTGHRLVTLVGPGGTGKTRLATQAAADLTATTPDGVWLAELAPVNDPVDLPHAVLAALGTPETVTVTTTLGAPPTVRDREEHLLAVLAPRRLLLILDNCEHLVAAVADLTDRLLAHCPAVRILATSRAPLGITGEKLYPVPPLELPADGADVDTIRDTAAVRLLTDRAGAVRPGFTVDTDNAAAVTQICRRLDGAPLALELAAARLRTLTPVQVADRLDDRFRLLTGGNRVALPRHQNLRAVVGWSWDLLDDEQRALARRLSVFPGGATLDAAEQVCTDPVVLPTDRVLDALTGLVDQSLVETDDDRSTTRYRMLDTIRAYAAEQLAAAGETDRLRRAHLDHYLHLAEHTEPLLRTRRQDEAVALLGAEYDNLLTALRHAVDRADGHAALRLGAALLWYWFLLGYANDGSFWLREVMRIAPDEPPTGLAARYAMCYLGSQLDTLPEQLADPRAAAEKLDRFEHLGRRAAEEGPLHPVLKLTAIARAMLSGAFDTARTALDTLVTDNDPWIAAAAHLLRAQVLQGTLNESEKAGRDVAAAVDEFRTLGDRWGLSMALVAHGEHLVMIGELPRAADTLAEAWQVASRFIAERERPQFLVRLAGIRVRAGDIDAAERDLAHAATLRAALPPTSHQPDRDWYQPDLVAAEVHRVRGRHEAARTCYQRVLDTAGQPTTPPQLAAIAAAGLARVEHDSGHRDTAEDLLTRALTTLAPSRDLPVLALLLGVAIVVTDDTERVAVLSGALGALHKGVTHHDPQLTGAIAAARAALDPEKFRAAHHRGTGLDFAGVYHYLDVPLGPPGPHAARQPKRPQ